MAADSPRGQGQWPRIFADAALCLVVAAVYFLAGKAGLKLAFLNASATAVWPPTGIALAALLIWGFRVWPGVMLGAFFVNLTTAGTALTAFGISIGNTLEGMLGAYLVNRFANGRFAFLRAKNVFRFTFLAAMLSTMVSATVGVAVLFMSGLATWADAGAVWLTWWLGDATGAIVIAPLLLSWSVPQDLSWPRKRFLEAVLLLATLALAGLVTFGGLIPGFSRGYPLGFLCIPPLIWAAFRFGPRETVTASVLLSGMAIRGTLFWHGPFAVASQNTSLLLLQAFIGVNTVMVMAVAAIVFERRAARARLITAYERLRTLEGLKDQLLMSTSHALKTPITPITLQVQMLLEGIFGKVSRAQAKSLDIILRNMKRLSQLINNLLDISVIHAGGLKLEMGEASIADCIKGVVESMVPVARRKHVSLTARVPQIPASVFDSNRIRQVIMGLVDNAIKFTRERGKVSVEAVRQGETIVVRVRDTGIGIPRNALNKLFRPFYQVPRTTTRGTAGPGLGLAIYKAIVEKHGGTIWVKSTFGKGSTFSFTIPFLSKQEAGKGSNILPPGRHDI